MGDFNRAIEFVLSDRIEGGYVNNPKDPGGETNFGISKRAYPKENIKALTKERAIRLYKRDYWDAIGGGALPSPLDLVLFDSAVNEGPGTARKHLAEALEAQGRSKVGDANPEWLAADIIFLRLTRYASLSTWATFGKGWVRRMVMLYDEVRAA
ncbi:MAG: glycosyl hydrolase 108 family protein [Thermodesulfobacteriota bacterium]|nr:glycosyl hydrolase 108 family protein [Thermodesulfobacteriota bacterium]